MFSLADVSYKPRPFEITNEEFARLFVAYMALCEEVPELVNYDNRQPQRNIHIVEDVTNSDLVVSTS